MAVFEMLSEMVGAEEFLRLVALAEFVHRRQVLDSSGPIRSGDVGEFVAAIAADVDVWRTGRGGRVEGRFDAGEVCA